MSVRDMSPGGRLEVRRGDAVVCIPLYGAHDLFVRCLRSVLAHTPADVPILIADDAGPDERSRTWAQQLPDDREVLWLRQPENLGFVGNCNAAFALTAPADVVLLNSDCEVAAGWLEGLRDAATADSTIATATALSNNATILSVPHRNHPQPELPKHLTFEDAAARVRAASPRLRPRLPTAIGHCMYIRRAALDLTGGFDAAFAPAYGEEVDFSQRCLLHGLQHVAADEVLVLHHGGASLNVEGRRNPLQEQHDRLIATRYPYYEDLVRDVERDEESPLARTLRAARGALLRMTVTIDGRSLTNVVTGTQIHTMELIHALWRTGRMRLRVVTPPDLGSWAQQLFDQMPDVELIEHVHVHPDTPRDDVVHRPFQITRDEDIELMELLGHRAVVTHHDLIAYRNPAYFASAEEFLEFRALTRRGLSRSDLVVFVSAHGMADAVAEDLLPADRGAVVFNGIDHELAALQLEPEAPADAEGLAGAPFLLCLGTDFQHKNRVFALKLLGALRSRGWDGRLVFAGPRVAQGSSGGAEAEWLSLHGDVARSLVQLPAVSEAEKLWLYRHAAAVLYPTTYEGFGLVPFEAAQHGVACLWAPQASLVEVLDGVEAPLVAWDPEASAERVLPLLRDDKARAAQCEAILDRGRDYTWARAAEQLADAYEALVRTPARAAARMATENARVQLAHDSIELRYWDLVQRVGKTGMALVGPEGTLPDEAQRAIAGLVRRRSTRGPVLAALRALGRAGGGDNGGGG